LGLLHATMAVRRGGKLLARCSAPPLSVIGSYPCANSCPSPNASYSRVRARASKLALQHPYSDNDLLSFAMQLPDLRKYKTDLRLCAAAVLRWVTLERWFHGPLPGFGRDLLAADRLDRQGQLQLAENADPIEDHGAGLAIHPWRLRDAALKGGA
jgi:hypothetical protein